MLNKILKSAVELLSVKTYRNQLWMCSLVE